MDLLKSLRQPGHAVAADGVAQKRKVTVPYQTLFNQRIAVRNDDFIPGRLQEKFPGTK
jgi:hypothetical protein